MSADLEAGSFSSARLAGALLCACVLGGGVAAQGPEPTAGLVAMHQARLDAANPIVVLNVAAHPDDESSRTNTMLRRKHGMRVVTVYSTYGDGGQNAIGREIGPELARLRVRETLRAAAMMDVEVRWLGMTDFGFSKTLDETLRIWGEERLLAAMRDVVDSVDPDVVVTNHSLTRGHGHHRASFWAIVEVLKERAAAGGFAPRLYARCGVADAQLAFDPSELDFARGETYARLAHRAWTQHVTQGPWAEHDPLQVGRDYWYAAWPEGVPADVAADLSTWLRAPGEAAQVTTSLAFADVRDELLAARARLAAATADLQQPGAVRQARLLRRRADALQRLLCAVSGVRPELWLAADEVPIGGTGSGHVVVHGVERVADLSIECDGEPAVPVKVQVRPTFFDGMVPPPATANGGDEPAGAAPPPEPAPEPALESAPAGRFQFTFPCEVDDDRELPLGLEPSFAEVLLEFTVDGVQVTLLERLPYTPVPPIEIAWDREVLLVPEGQRSDRLLSVSVKSHRPRTDAAVRLQMGPGIEASATPSRLSLTPEHREARILVRATIDADEMAADSGLGVGFRGEVVRLPVQVVDVSVPPGLRVALVRGPEDTTERTLADLGIDFVSLDRDALVTTRLEQFSALLFDIRAYHHRPELAEVRDRVLQYCRAGGRVVAMYHKPGEWNERPAHPLLAPFPLTIGNERVTEEDAPVTVLQPSHRLMNYPHEIDAGDFADWVQERGLNFPKAWDPAWTPMLAMRDSGDEKPHEGSLLYTQYGRGDFVYCSLALYRQLRVGNAGAVRLLVNLLAK